MSCDLIIIVQMLLFDVVDCPAYTTLLAQDKDKACYKAIEKENAVSSLLLISQSY